MLWTPNMHTHNLIAVVRHLLSPRVFVCCILCEIFTQTLENLNAMKTGSSIEVFRLTAVSKARRTGTEWCNLTQENHNEAKQCNHRDTSQQNRDNKWKSCRHYKLYLDGRLLRRVNQEIFTLSNVSELWENGVLGKNRVIGEFETFSGRLTPRLCLCEPTVCQRFLK